MLEPTPDILAALGARKRPGQILVGFAAETDDVVANADAKLRRKNLDLIVANDVGAPRVGFQHDTNAVMLLRRGGAARRPADGQAFGRQGDTECVAELRSGVSSSDSTTVDQRQSNDSGAAQ